MRRVFFVTLILALFTALGAVAAESATNAAKPPARVTNPQVRHADDPSRDVSTGSGLPTISKFQTPKAIPNIGCTGGENGDPCIDDWGGGGYTEGGCNCSRYCDNASRGCTLAQSRTTGCQAVSTTQSVCTDCSERCTW